MMQGPQEHVVHEAKEKKPAKFGQTFGDGLNQLDIWYTEATKPDESGFGAIVEARELALQMVRATVAALEARNAIASKALAAHFGRLDIAKDTGPVKLVVERYHAILRGLSAPFTICLAKSPRMGKGARGLTSKRLRIHLNLAILGNHRLALARTIVHEASHAFAGLPGYEMEDGHATVELYAHQKGYQNQCADVAIDCADSYAWAALSIYKGHLTRPWNLSEPDGFNDEVGCVKCG